MAEKKMLGFASHRYITNLKDAQAHIRYIGFREREDKSESLGLFSEHEDSTDAHEFIDSLNVKRFSHPKDPYIHTVLFSMSGKEWEQSGFQPGDYQKMIRDVMKELEVKNGYTLKWVAAEHRNPDHPHAHVVIRASYFDRDGVERKLELSDSDRRFLREQWQKTKELHRPMEPSWSRDFEPNRGHNFDIDRTFVDQLFKQIDRELAEKEREREISKKSKDRYRGKTNRSKEMQQEHIRKRDR